jgi:hypothetical protein
MTGWSVICRPVAENPDGKSRVAGRNLSGLKVLLVNPDVDEFEVCRVAFVRRNSKHKKVPFEEQLQIELEKAWDAAETLNALDQELEAAKKDAMSRARQEIRSLLGRTSTTPV